MSYLPIHSVLYTRTREDVPEYAMNTEWNWIRSFTKFFSPKVWQTDLLRIWQQERQQNLFITNWNATLHPSFNYKTRDIRRLPTSACRLAPISPRNDIAWHKTVFTMYFIGRKQVMWGDFSLIKLRRHLHASYCARIHT